MCEYNTRGIDSILTETLIQERHISVEEVIFEFFVTWS